MANTALDNWFCCHHHDTTLQKGPEQSPQWWICIDELCSVPFPSGGTKWLHFFQNKLFYFSQKVLHGNKAQTCTDFLVSFGFVLHQLWDVSPTTQPFCEGFVRTEEMVIRTVFKEQIKKIRIKNYWLPEHLSRVIYCCIDKKARNSIICSMTLTGWNVG